MEKNEHGIPVIERFEIGYDRQQIIVELVEIDHGPPEQMFYIYAGCKEAVLHKRFLKSQGKSIWITGGDISHEGAQKFRPGIERQWGRDLPPKQVDDPFKYKGDIPVIFYLCDVGSIRIRQAKAVFTEDLYYQVILDEGVYRNQSGSNE